jgi:hypothetical protein
VPGGAGQAFGCGPVPSLFRGSCGSPCLSSFVYVVRCHVSDACVEPDPFVVRPGGCGSPPRPWPWSRVVSRAGTCLQGMLRGTPGTHTFCLIGESPVMIGRSDRDGMPISSLTTGSAWGILVAGIVGHRAIDQCLGEYDE